MGAARSWVKQGRRPGNSIPRPPGKATRGGPQPAAPSGRNRQAERRDSKGAHARLLESPETVVGSPSPGNSHSRGRLPLLVIPHASPRCIRHRRRSASMPCNPYTPSHDQGLRAPGPLARFKLLGENRPCSSSICLGAGVICIASRQSLGSRGYPPGRLGRGSGDPRGSGGSELSAPCG